VNFKALAVIGESCGGEAQRRRGSLVWSRELKTRENPVFAMTAWRLRFGQFGCEGIRAMATFDVS